jgi:hypothetical protein
MNTRPHPDSSSTSTGRRALRPLPGTRAFCGGTLLLLLLGWGGAAPAGAESGTITGPRTGPITVNAGETLDIVDGAQISGSATGVFVLGGTVNISGGSIDGSIAGVNLNSGTVTVSSGSISSGYLEVYIRGGTATISGGSVSGSSYGVLVPSGGTVNISGGSFTGSIVGVTAPGGTASISGGSFSGSWGLAVQSGTMTISGCGLKLSGNQLTGTLQDGTPINTRTGNLSAGSLQNADSGLGTDDVPGDIQIVDAHHLKLRAERYSRQGRVYTLTVTGTDAAGNQTRQTVTVSVPH